MERARRGGSCPLTEEDLRAAMLYHVLLVQVGHWVEWRARVLDPAARLDVRTRSDLEGAYLARSRAEREQAAQRYANRHAARLSAADAIPFPPQI